VAFILSQLSFPEMPPKGGDTQRKEWNKDEYRQKAKEREQSYHKKPEIPVDKSTLAILEARPDIKLNEGINQKKTVSAVDAVIQIKIGNFGVSLWDL
jgi:hypothetical protein